MTYEIPAANMPRLRARVAEMNRRAAKLGVEPVAFAELARWCTLGRMTPTGFEGRGVICEVEVTGAAIRLPGWTFVGTIEHLPGGENILRAAPGEEIPEAYRTATRHCDHCHTDRARTDTYVVRSDAGEYRQIGRSCTRDYLGHIDPARLAQFMQWVASVGDDEDRDTWGGYEPKNWTPQEIVELAAACTRMFGFVTSAQPLSTAARIGALVGGRGQLFEEMRRAGFEVEPADTATAAAAIQWAATTTEASSYAANLRTLARSESVTARHFGLLASLPMAHQRAQESDAVRAVREAERAAQQAERAARLAASGGEAPEGEQTVEGIVLRTETRQSAYGYNRFELKMTVEDARGFRVWATIPAKLADDIEAGTRVRFTATLKRSDRDAAFAFASRLKGAAIVSAAPEAIAC